MTLLGRFHPLFPIYAHRMRCKSTSANDQNGKLCRVAKGNYLLGKLYLNYVFFFFFIGRCVELVCNRWYIIAQTLLCYCSWSTWWWLQLRDSYFSSVVLAPINGQKGHSEAPSSSEWEANLKFHSKLSLDCFQSKKSNNSINWSVSALQSNCVIKLLHCRNHDSYLIVNITENKQFLAVKCSEEE